MERSVESRDRQSDILLVVGSHAGCFDDAVRLEMLGVAHDVLAINDAVVYFPGELAHAASLHADQLDLWVRLRALKRRSDRMPEDRPTVHALSRGPRVDRVWTGKPYASSGFFGVRIGLGLGYRLVLACLPLEGRHFWDPETRILPYGRYHDRWTEAKQRGELDRVRAWLPRTDTHGQGFVSRLLGAPSIAELGVTR